MKLWRCDDILERCSYSDPVFSKYAPNTKRYKEELIRRLQKNGPDKSVFYTNMYSEKDGKQFMSVFIKGDSLCARGMLDITNAAGLEHFRKVKGINCYGYALDGLKYKIDTLKDDYNFIFESVDAIEDTSYRYVCDCR